MAGASIEVKAYSDIPEDQRTLPRTNWVVDGENNDWLEIVDTRYGRVAHTRVVNEDGSRFDKVNLVWTPGAFIVVFRRNPEKGQVEYLLPSERRILLRDENGEQGNVFIRNIPQGVIRVWKDESPAEAAVRETVEETGLYPTELTHMRDLFPDAANSETPHPFFLAEVPFQPVGAYDQSLHEGEDIKVSEDDWFGVEEIHDLRLQCAKTLAGIMLSTGFLGEWNRYSQTKQLED